jgi:hypothetical protein
LGWGVLLCYRELAKSLSYRRLTLLAGGGGFYSAGAAINLAGWPVLSPGVFGAHELFHFFVLAGSACHVCFMLRVVVPATPPQGWHGAGERLATGTWLPLPLPTGPLSLRYRRQAGGALYGRPHLAAGAPADPAAGAMAVAATSAEP